MLGLLDSTPVILLPLAESFSISVACACPWQRCPTAPSQENLSFSSGPTAPAGASYAWILLRTRQVGTYCFDDLSFAVAGGGELLANNGAEASAYGTVASWTPTIDFGAATHSWDTGTVHNGNRSLCVTMTVNGQADWRQLVGGIVPGRAYSFNGWIYARLRPTWDETRFMAYDAVIHGARGLLYWGTAYVPQNAGLWVDLRRLAAEMSSLSAPLTARSSLREVWADTQSVEVLLLASGGNLYLLSANRTPAPVSTSFFVSGLPFGTAERMFEGGTLSVSENGFSDSFAAYQVHVYRLH